MSAHEQKFTRIKPREPGDDWRISFVLASIGPQPFSADHSIDLQQALDNPRNPDPDTWVKAHEGDMYVSMAEHHSDDDATALERAVRRLDEGMVRSMLPGVIALARVMPYSVIRPGTGPVEMFRYARQQDDRTPEAQDLHTQISGQAIDDLAQTMLSEIEQTFSQ